MTEGQKETIATRAMLDRFWKDIESYGAEIAKLAGSNSGDSIANRCIRLVYAEILIRRCERTIDEEAAK